MESCLGEIHLASLGVYSGLCVSICGCCLSRTLRPTFSPGKDALVCLNHGHIANSICRLSSLEHLELIFSLDSDIRVSTEHARHMNEKRKGRHILSHLCEATLLLLLCIVALWLLESSHGEKL